MDASYSLLAPVYINSLFQPSGLLAFLESVEAPPAAVLDEERLQERDNLQLAQATLKQRSPHIEAIERQLKYVEKHIEVILDYIIQKTTLTVLKVTLSRESCVSRHLDLTITKYKSCIL